MINQSDIERYLGRREIERMELVKRIEILEDENKELKEKVKQCEEPS